MAITQVSKTIIFEQFSPGINSNNEPTERLDFLLTKNTDERLVRKIEECLGVSSYDEFLQKFNPVIYESKVMNPDTREVSFMYSIDIPKGPSIPINIENQKFYKMAQQIYTQKNTSGQSNLSFDYKEIMECLMPQKTIDEARTARQKLDYNLNKYLQVLEKDPESEDVEEYADKIEEIREDIAEKYYNKSISTALTLALADNKAKLDYYDNSQKTSDADSIAVNASLPCNISFDPKGNLLITEVESSTQERDTKRLSTTKQMIQMITMDYEANVEESDNSSDTFVKNCIISSFCGVDVDSIQNESTSLMMPDRQELIEQRDTYNKLYKNIQESFANQMIALVEKFLNIRAFFDHAAVNNGRTETKVIIANCHITDLMKDDVKPYFMDYIKRLNEQNNDEKLWYMVVPALYEKNFMDTVKSRKKVDILDPVRKGNKSEETQNNGLVTFNAFKNFMTSLKDENIKGVFTFFNFKGGEKTSFSSIGSDSTIIRKFKSKCDEIDKEMSAYSIFCYPNFTVQSKPDSVFAFGKVTSDYGGEKNISLKFPGIYIDSSYVACGMMIAAHSNYYLKSKGFNIKEGPDAIPPVRIDFDGIYTDKRGNNITAKEKLTTKMNRESGLSMSKDSSDEIKSNGGFGFCFSSENLCDSDGNELKNAYVINARTIELKTDKDTGITAYTPAFASIVKVFLERMYSFQGQKNMDNLIKKWNNMAEKKYANNVVYIEDSIEMKIVVENGRNVAYISTKYGDFPIAYDVVIE